MSDVNPVERLQQEAAKNIEAKHRYSEICKQVYADEATLYLTSVPSLIVERDFVDCKLVNWEGDDYAAFDLGYFNDDYNRRGLDVQLLFSGSQGYLFIVGSRERHNKLTGGTVLDDENCHDYLLNIPEKDIIDSLAKFSILSEAPKDERVNDHLSATYDFQAFKVGLEIRKNLAARIRQQFEIST